MNWPPAWAIAGAVTTTVAITGGIYAGSTYESGHQAPIIVVQTVYATPAQHRHHHHPPRAVTAPVAAPAAVPVATQPRAPEAVRTSRAAVQPTPVATLSSPAPSPTPTVSAIPGGFGVRR